MAYINIQTLEYPLYEGDIKLAFPNTSFPVIFTPPDGYATVVDVPVPSYDWVTQGLREVTPVEVNGVWTQTWEVYALSEAEVIANTAIYRERLYNSIVNSTQKRLDDFAKTRQYDGILSACTYATDSNPRFQSDGQYCVQQRSATWAKLIEMLAEVDAGTRPVPTSYADVEPELPPLVWPN